MANKFESEPFLLFALDPVKAKRAETTNESKDLYQRKIALENHKAFLDAVLKSDATLTFYGKIFEVMQGVSYHNLKTWNSMINSNQADFTRHIVWAYKVLWEFLYAENTKNETTYKDKLRRMNKLDDWKKLGSADFFIADNHAPQKLAKKIFKAMPAEGFKTFVPHDEARDRWGLVLNYEILNGSDEWERAKDITPFNYYAISPVARYPTDARKDTPDYNFSATPPWLDEFALKYVTTTYKLPYGTRSRLPTKQHVYDTTEAYRSQNSRDKNRSSQASLYKRASNIQQLTETPAGWRNILYAFDDSGQRFWTLYNKDEKYKKPVAPIGSAGSTIFDNNDASIDLSLNTLIDYNDAEINDGSKLNRAFDIDNLIMAFLVGPQANKLLAKFDKDRFKRFMTYLQNVWGDDLYMGSVDGLDTSSGSWDYGSSQEEARKLGLYVPSAKESHKKLKANLLNPVYKVQLDTSMMMFAMRLVVYVADKVFDETIAFKADDGTQLKLFGGGFQDYDLNPGTSDEQDEQIKALKGLITICWSLINSFEEADATVRKIEEANSELPERSDKVVKGEARKKQILKNMQCFMLNAIDVFQEFDGMSGFTGPHMQIEGDCSNIFNLLGYKPETIDKMLKIKPNELAKMQPRIKLFKERKTYKKNSNVLQDYKLVEVKGPFSTHTSTKSIQAALEQGGGRSLGGGIVEVDIVEEHGDAVFDLPSFITVEIKFLFNTLQEIFLNFPNIDEDGKITFPYGRQPSAAGLDPEDVPASFAELVFPLTANKKQEDYLSVVNTHREEFNVVVELGWSPPDNLKNLTSFEKKFFKDLNLQNLYKTYLLNPYDTEFNFTNEGQVELTARYHGIERALQKNTSARLFPRAGQYHNRPLSEDAKVVEDVAEIKRLSKIKRKKPLSSKQDLALQKARHRLDEKVQNKSMEEFHNFIRYQLSELMNNLFIYNAVWVLRVPRALLGARDDNNILKWSPTQNVEALKMFPRNVSRPSDTRFGKDVGERVVKTLNNTAYKTKKDYKENKSWVEYYQRKKGTKEYKNMTPKEKEEFDKEYGEYQKKVSDYADASKQSKTVQKALKKELDAYGGWSVEDDSYPIFWTYFGDIMTDVFDFSKAEYKRLMENLQGVVDLGTTTGAFNEVHVILGTVKMPVIRGGEYVIYNVPIEKIPIVTSFVTKFIIDNLVSPGAYYITKIEFVTKLFRAVLQEYFSAECFVGSYEVSRTAVERLFFDLPSSKKDDLTGKHGLWDLSRGWGPNTSRQEFKNKMIKMEESLNKNKDNISLNPRFKYCFLGTRSFSDGSYNYKKDLEDNIHHFYFGAGEGLIKSVNFVSEEMPHQTEALILEGADGLEVQADAFVPRLFNCEVTMIGNTLFNPGHTFYFDPTMGTVLGQVGDVSNKVGINVIKNTGLGGYFYVTKVQHRLGPGSFETILEGKKTGVTKKKDSSSQVPFNKEMDPGSVKIPEASDLTSKLSLTDLAGAAMSKIGDKIGL